MQFFFIPGWNLTHHFWRYWDVSQWREAHEIDWNQPVIGVGHSMGFQKLMQYKCDGYVSINGFTNFCGGDPMRKRALASMIRTYGPGTIPSFAKRSGIPIDCFDESIGDDLNDLKLSVPGHYDKPLLYLHSQDDPIVPVNDFSSWKDVKKVVHPGDIGHELGFKEPHWCWNEIEQWGKKQNFIHNHVNHKKEFFTTF